MHFDKYTQLWYLVPIHIENNAITAKVSLCPHEHLAHPPPALDDSSSDLHHCGGVFLVLELYISGITYIKWFYTHAYLHMLLCVLFFFLLHNVLGIYSCCVSVVGHSYCWVVLHSINVSLLIYRFFCWWTFVLFFFNISLYFCTNVVCNYVHQNFKITIIIKNSKYSSFNLVISNPERDLYAEE